MKQIAYALGLSALLFSCQQKETAATFTPRILTSDEKFNETQLAADSVLKVYKYKPGKEETNTAAEAFSIKFKDTLVRIQINKADPNSFTDKFSFVQPINTQKTAMLVQLADHPDLATAFYLIAFKDEQLNVVSLSRPSTGEHDSKFTNGLNKIGRGGFLVNNDFFITNVNAQVYLIKRQNPAERIQGAFILNSPDKSTLVFLQSSSLYQVHYESNDTFTERLSKPAPADADLSEWIKNNFNWEKNKKGITYLKFSDNNRIVDISEFS